MRISIGASGISNDADIVTLRADPKHRKAPPNAFSVLSAIQNCVGSHIDLFNAQKNSMAVIFATGHGELGITTDFFEELAKSDVARPFLFQNSLHHSTLGYVTTHLGLKGPGFTVSNQHFSGESALTVAQGMLQGGFSQSCLIVGFDSLPHKLTEVYSVLYPQRMTPSEYAAALWVGTEDFFPGQPIITHVACHPSPEKQSPPMEHFEADAIRRFIEAISLEKSGEALLVKPDGTLSTLTWVSGCV